MKLTISSFEVCAHEYYYDLWVIYLCIIFIHRPTYNNAYIIHLKKYVSKLKNKQC